MGLAELVDAPVLLAGDIDRVKECLESLGLDLIDLDIVDNYDRVGGCHCAQCALESQTLYLLIEGVAVIAGLRSKCYAAVSPHGRTLVACACAAGALLAPGLCGRVADLALVECALGSLTSICQVVLDAVM